MVPLTGAHSELLFNELESWEHVLSTLEADIEHQSIDESDEVRS